MTSERKPVFGQDHVQCVVFDKEEGWILSAARAWMEKHGLETDGLVVHQGGRRSTKIRFEQYAADTKDWVYDTVEDEDVDGVFYVKATQRHLTQFKVEDGRLICVMRLSVGIGDLIEKADGRLVLDEVAVVQVMETFREARGKAEAIISAHRAVKGSVPTQDASGAQTVLCVACNTPFSLSGYIRKREDCKISCPSCGFHMFYSSTDPGEKQ